MHRTLNASETRIDWLKSAPFIIIHLVPLGLFWTGARPIDWVVCIALYFARMFFITGAYHRYFAHRSYKMGRVMQFLMGWGGCMATQKGPLWWAAHHRVHHKMSDLPGDVHSPKDGFWWSHVAWIMSNAHDETLFDKIKDMAKYPELRWLNRFYYVPPLVMALVCYLAGGLSMMLCGAFLSTALLYHGTFAINSFAHIWGKRRFVTTDTSRNSLICALITMGEGWHNNHHYYQSSANMGFYWWEIDMTYYILKMLSWIGLVWDLRKPPAHVLTSNLVKDNQDVGMVPTPTASVPAPAAE